jgi:hypothetical protein
VADVIPATLVFEAAVLRAGPDARRSVDIFSQHYLENFNSGRVGGPKGGFFEDSDF